MALQPGSRLRRRLASSALARRVWRRLASSAALPERRTAQPDVGTYLDVARSLQLRVTHVVLLCGKHGVRTANALAEQLPEATVHLLSRLPHDPRRMAAPLPAVRYSHCADTQSVAEYLVRVPPPELLIDAGAKREHMLARVRILLGFVVSGGAYLLDDVGAAEQPDLRWPELAGLAAADGAPPAGWPPEVVASCSSVEITGRVAAVTKAFEHRINLRDARATEILTARYGDAWGAVVGARPPTNFKPRAAVFEHGDRGEWFGQVQRAAGSDRIEVPELTVRRYDGATCWFEQRIARDNYWLPDTFRHPYDNLLRHRRLARISPWHARLPHGTAPAPTRHLDGRFFYFDTEYPGHFGHVLTEVIARHWGWLCAREADPQVRPLLTRKDAGMPSFQEQLFRALDIDLAEVTYIEPGEAVTVDTVYAASPMFSMPAYISPELGTTWDLVREGVYRPGRPNPKRLFVSRRVHRVRSCLNTEEVEAFVRDRGFEIYYPEEHDFANQVSAFVDADVIAGFAGSNMFTAMFAGPKKVVAITADSYSANNEFLIASVTGGELHQVICDAEIKHPNGGWTWAAYQSNFAVDLSLLAAGLDAADDSDRGPGPKESAHAST